MVISIVVLVYQRSMIPITSRGIHVIRDGNNALSKHLGWIPLPVRRYVLYYAKMICVIDRQPCKYRIVHI